MAMQEGKQAMTDALFAGPEGSCIGPLALDETQIMKLFAPLAAGETCNPEPRRKADFLHDREALPR
jgi:hypothetical protein